MSTLLKRATRLVQRTKDVREAQLATQRQEAYQQRFTELQDYCDQFVALQKQVDLLVTEDCIVRRDVRSDVQEGALELVALFRRRFHENPSVAVEGDEYGALAKKLERAASVTKQLMRQAWEKHFSNQVPEVPEDSLEMRLAPPELSRRITNLTGLLAQRASVPSTPGEIARFREYVSQLEQARQDAWQSVLGEGEKPPAGTQEFVLAAGRPEGVPLSRMTPEILAWLEHRGLLDRFRASLS